MVVIRDFYALLIPSGVNVRVTAGTVVEITQFKGGNATIYFKGNLARVANADLDAIGKSESSLEEQDLFADQPLNNEINLELIWKVLKTCYDPEIPVNIVDLGLIYDCKVIDKKVVVHMTLTAPMCGMGPILVEDIKNILLKVPNVHEVEVHMVFDPPWTIDRMSETAKLELGLI